MSDVDSKALPLVQVRSVSKTFEGGAGQTVALEGISFDLKPSEFLVVMGPSGCGKSTLLGLLAGHETPATGDILFYGKPAKGPNPQRAVVFQEDTLLQWRTLLDNLSYTREVEALQRCSGLFRFLLEIAMIIPFMTKPVLAALIKRSAGLGPAEAFAHDLDLLKMVGLEAFANAWPAELSGGMRKRGELARALTLSPAVLLADEPFGSLDALTKEQCQNVLLRIWQKAGFAIVFVTHDAAEAALLADRVLILTQRPGRIDSILDVPLPRPRIDEIRMSREYLDLVESIHRKIRNLNMNEPDDSVYRRNPA